MANQPKMSSVELGALWMTYHKKTMILRILEYIIEKADEDEAKSLMTGLWNELHPMVIEIQNLLGKEGAAQPEGFTKEDVNLDAPKLWENGFDIMLCRFLKEVSTGMYALHLTISYREDIVKFYKKLTKITEYYYNAFTQYLLEKAIIPRPTLVNMPKSIDFITDKKYFKGTNLAGQKRQMNTVEYGVLYRAIESNVTGMQLLKGFIQCTDDKEVQKYFSKGLELAKNTMKTVGDMMLEDDIPPLATQGGTVTSSTIAPFSNRLMLFCNYLFGSFALGGQGFSATLLWRNDLVLHTATEAKGIFDYNREGLELMMKMGWIEEPPVMDL